MVRSTGEKIDECREDFDGERKYPRDDYPVISVGREEMGYYALVIIETNHGVAPTCVGSVDGRLEIVYIFQGGRYNARFVVGDDYVLCSALAPSYTVFQNVPAQTTEDVQKFMEYMLSKHMPVRHNDGGWWGVD